MDPQILQQLARYFETSVIYSNGVYEINLPYDEYHKQIMNDANIRIKLQRIRRNSPIPVAITATGYWDHLNWHNIKMDIRQEATNIDKNYGKVVANFLALVESDSSLSKVRKHFKRFSSKYTMIPSLWIKWLQLESVQNFPDFNASTSNHQIEKIKVAAKKHFLHNEFEDNNKGGHFDANIFVHFDFNKIFETSMQNSTTMKPLEKALMFPHFGIKNTKTYCELFGTHPLPTSIIKRYKRSKIIADLFENEEGIRQEWFQEVIKCLDKDFIIKSFEYALGIYPQCYDAWKLYISYLKKINATMLMLTVYSKCCRLFIDDLEIWKKIFEKS